MVKVIKKGSEREFEIECKLCNSLISYTNRDIKEKCIYRDIEIINKLVSRFQTGVQCPECGHFIMIGEFSDERRID